MNFSIGDRKPSFQLVQLHFWTTVRQLAHSGNFWGLQGFKIDIWQNLFLHKCSFKPQPPRSYTMGQLSNVVCKVLNGDVTRNLVPRTNPYAHHQKKGRLIISLKLSFKTEQKSNCILFLLIIAFLLHTSSQAPGINSQRLDAPSRPQ